MHSPNNCASNPKKDLVGWPYNYTLLLEEMIILHEKLLFSLTDNMFCQHGVELLRYRVIVVCASRSDSSIGK